MSDHCKRTDGTLRAWFTSRQAAQDFEGTTPDMKVTSLTSASVVSGIVRDLAGSPRQNTSRQW
jgi:hypothetical protein